MHEDRRMMLVDRDTGIDVGGRNKARMTDTRMSVYVECCELGSSTCGWSACRSVAEFVHFRVLQTCGAGPRTRRFAKAILPIAE